MWIARRLWWGTILIGIVAALAAHEGEARTTAWRLVVLAAALSVIDQVLFFVEEREWVRDYLSTLGPRMLVLRVMSMGLPFYFVLRFATLTGVALLTYWIARVLHWST